MITTDRRWNAQMVQGLVELDILQRKQTDVDDLRELIDDKVEEISDWAAVELISASLGLPDFWNDVWGPWQQTESAHSRAALARIEEVALQKVPACAGIAAAYAPYPALRALWGERLEMDGALASVWALPRMPSPRRVGQS